MADQEKADAKDASTKGGEDRDKVLARLDDSSKVLNELLGAPDNGIPDDVFQEREVRCRCSVHGEGRLRIRR